jgi:hypothetical protein
MTGNVQSFFNNCPDNKDTEIVDTLTMPLDQKMEYVRNLEIEEFTFLDECMIHIYDNSLNPAELNLCNLLGAMTTDNIVPFLTTHVVVDKITPVLR